MHKDIYHPPTKSIYEDSNFYSNISIGKHIINPIIQPNQLSSKTVHDPVHGYMTFSHLMWSIIDTPQFQRLRNLKQLSTVSFIYPGGNHTRFEHCLGTGYLANDLAVKCFKSINTENKFLIDSVAIGGLCHDIGHGPFSHTFNTVLSSLNIGENWEHEVFSEKLLKYLIDTNHIDIDNEMLSLANSFIQGEQRDYSEYPWLFHIVANKTNSIDVDKFDYICRDIYHLGLNCSSVDYMRVFNDCRIIDNKICFAEKNDLPLLSIFRSRFELFKKVYKHNKNHCIDTMVKDALILSNDYFHFEEAIESPELFMSLTDDIIHIIKNFSKNEDTEINSNPNLLKAEKIIRNLYSRKTYRFVGEILIPSNSYYVPDLNDYLSFNNPKDNYYLTKEDIDIQKVSIDFGNKDSNPFENIYFYNSKIPDKCFKKLQKNSLILPSIFKEYYIKVICKSESKLERAKELFGEYKKKLLSQWNIKQEDSKIDIGIADGEVDGDDEGDGLSKEFLSKKRESNTARENILTPIKKIHKFK